LLHDFQATVNFLLTGTIPSGLDLVLGQRLIDSIAGEEFFVDDAAVPSIPTS
jgi:hypothetical protein